MLFRYRLIKYLKLDAYNIFHFVNTVLWWLNMLKGYPNPICAYLRYGFSRKIYGDNG